MGATFIGCGNMYESDQVKDPKVVVWWKTQVQICSPSPSVPQ